MLERTHQLPAAASQSISRAAQTKEPDTAQERPSIRAVLHCLRETRRVIEQAGWAHGRPQTLDGRVSLASAVAIAADGDERLAEVTRVFLLSGLPLFHDLVSWNDEPGRDLYEVTGLIDRAAAVAAP